ncbi:MULTISPECIES: nickel pincer cofactor biosynthesis protein LarC [Spirulina sp. CCY15215]|uniref:nickel pincer cofactor biosynthesis protein LarC n=1 Tax=Spirulina sp. CCY15215 TaxID=2767591 RepID=UPI00194DD9DE|nr:nickel pincer cofactor biosynthesis protein LarC [Spirulina major]
MAKIAYLDCPTGIAGDMFLGALFDLGMPLEYAIAQLAKLGLGDEFDLRVETVQRRGQRAIKAHIDLLSKQGEHHHHFPARHLPEIEHLIKSASLPKRVREWSLQVFKNLAEAEGAVHGIAPEKVHFHEVGATDAIVDIVGTCLGLDWLGIDELHCSALPTGGGTVKAAHGILPVPVPAVLKLWEMGQVPIYDNGIAMELVTPTGAALAVTLVTRFGSCPPLQLSRVGLGAGTKDLSMPNILRIWLGEVQSVANLEAIAVLETQIDDMNPQGIAYTCEQLLQAGALDVFTQAIAMKKFRMGILLTVICSPSQVVLLENILFRETTTLGIRRSFQERRILAREIQAVSTPYGTIRVKIARQGDKIINIQPEYEDCAKVAREGDRPWQEIHQLALVACQGFFGR